MLRSCVVVERVSGGGLNCVADIARVYALRLFFMIDIPCNIVQSL